MNGGLLRLNPHIVDSVGQALKSYLSVIQKPKIKYERQAVIFQSLYHAKALPTQLEQLHRIRLCNKAKHSDDVMSVDRHLTSL